MFFDSAQLTAAGRRRRYGIVRRKEEREVTERRKSRSKEQSLSSISLIPPSVQSAEIEILDAEQTQEK
ncbi:Protein of unknown function [Pyronema omphalodes CBS 100304]|uniref:Uncharacterized protein n=1 Tax=Pyronema omphalodes (strain CBS 100304) TaxID=1076935 RepID=U4LJ70_PYROM|nr:Protein of unknown function [Pyronema omphalodes CBS 100304]